jgi:hypothetical protein
MSSASGPVEEQGAGDCALLGGRARAGRRSRDLRTTSSSGVESGAGRPQARPVANPPATTNSARSPNSAKNARPAPPANLLLAYAPRASPPARAMPAFALSNPPMRSSTLRVRLAPQVRRAASAERLHARKRALSSDFFQGFRNWTWELRDEKNKVHRKGTEERGLH